MKLIKFSRKTLQEILNYSNTHNNFQVKAKYHLTDYTLARIFRDAGMTHRITAQNLRRQLHVNTSIKASALEKVGTEETVEALATVFEERVQDKKTITELKDKIEALLIQNRRLHDELELSQAPKSFERLENARRAMITHNRD